MENAPKNLPPNNAIMQRIWKFRRRLKYDSLFKTRYNLIRIVCVFLLLFMIPMFKGSSPNVNPTKLNDYVSFGNGDYQAKVTYHKYNPDSQLLVMKYQVASNTNSALPQLKFKNVSWQNEDSNLDTKVYRTDDNQYTVIINNLAPNYKMLKTTASYVDPANNDNNSQAEFYIGENGNIDNNLQELKASDYTTEAVNDEINKNNKNNTKKQAMIKKYVQSIQDNNKNIENYEATESYKIKSDKSDVINQINTLKGNNKSNVESINNLNKQIERNEQRNALLKQELTDISTGNFNFDKIITQR